MLNSSLEANHKESTLQQIGAQRPPMRIGLEAKAGAAQYSALRMEAVAFVLPHEEVDLPNPKEKELRT